MRAEGKPLRTTTKNITEPNYTELLDRIVEAKKAKKWNGRNIRNEFTPAQMLRNLGIFAVTFMSLKYASDNKIITFMHQEPKKLDCDIGIISQIDIKINFEQINASPEPLITQESAIYSSNSLEKTISYSEANPCVVSFDLFKVKFSGDCSQQEKNNAFAESDRLLAEHEEKQKLIGKKLSEEMEEKWIEEKAQLTEQVRRMSNPTAEELDEDMQEIYKKMDKKFQHRAGYIPRAEAPSPKVKACPESITNLEGLKYYKNMTPLELIKEPKINPLCKEHAELIFGINQQADYGNIKDRYRSLTLGYHPDKNHSEGAADAFNLITTAYETLTT